MGTASAQTITHDHNDALYARYQVHLAPPMPLTILPGIIAAATGTQ